MGGMANPTTKMSYDATCRMGTHKVDRMQMKATTCCIMPRHKKIFFFSSIRRHTSWNCDWSSDVCSSDLCGLLFDRCANFHSRDLGSLPQKRQGISDREPSFSGVLPAYHNAISLQIMHVFRYQDRGSARSEERRVGKESGVHWPVSK